MPVSDSIDDENDELFETDDETDRQQYGIYQCLPVDDQEPDWECAEPDTVEEYLRRVRYEARQLPSVVVSDVDPRAFDAQQTLQSQEHSPEVASAPALTPSIPWIRSFLRNFATLRHRLEREEEITSRCRGNSRSPLSHLESAELAAEVQVLALDTPSSTMPELEDLRGLSQVTIVDRLRRAIDAAVSRKTLLPIDAAQLYALSARIELPLHAETAAAYRALWRRCGSWRAEVSGAEDALLPHINILLAISGAFFQQDEEFAGLGGLYWDQDY